MQVVRVQDCIDFLGCFVKDGVLHHHNRVGDVIELTYEYEQPLAFTAAANARRPVGPWEEWSGLPEATDGD